MADALQVLNKRYTDPVLITNRNGVNVSTVTVSIAISKSFDDAPADDEFQSAEIVNRGDSWLRVHILVDRSQFTDGVYYEWVRLDSNPEIIPERVAQIWIGPTE